MVAENGHKASRTKQPQSPSKVEPHAFKFENYSAIKKTHQTTQLSKCNMQMLQTIFSQICYKIYNRNFYKNLQTSAEHANITESCSKTAVRALQYRVEEKESERCQCPLSIFNSSAVGVSKFSRRRSLPLIIGGNEVSITMPKCCIMKTI